MSSTSTQTVYTFSWTAASDQANFTFESGAGMTDAMAFALNDAFKNLGWAPGNVQASVTKKILTEEDLNEDDTTTPPSFT